MKVCCILQKKTSIGDLAVISLQDAVKLFRDSEISKKLRDRKKLKKMFFAILQKKIRIEKKLLKKRLLVYHLVF